MKEARLIFSDGRVYKGTMFASGGECTAEVVFNTAMTGYQEIITDPSYSGQMVVMTYPLIGSYGINDEDVESRKIFLTALIVKEYVDAHSNWRSKKSLKQYLEENNVMGVEGIDTRSLTKYIREQGAKMALLTTSKDPLEKLIEKVKQAKSMTGKNLAQSVTCDEPYQWKAPDSQKFRVAVLDCGVKYNILELLREGGCACTVYPVDTSPEVIKKEKYDGYFISNGPGDPEPVSTAKSLVQELLGTAPLFGICLGHQILCLALGGKSYKLKFGHHGANHPVMNLHNRKVEITSQNHGFAIDPDSLDESKVEVTHINLNDQTVAGVRHKTLGAFSVQYHPEASPGPHDSHYFFTDFFRLMEMHNA